MHSTKVQQASILREGPKEIKENELFFDKNGHLISWEKVDPPLKEFAIKAIVRQAYVSTLARDQAALD